ncbi:phage portal protein [Streptomyces phaeochromogenes]|uniref:phage portal protein n=1 Tax=Streptomyces phaeochromogenes TaxID=1923 RepID=UPI002257F863|nr:phage portal protein [Streptomyces phaeochromogenes]MCX5601616.1 phage portal protein [Streptomyces phaeochromogenes]
MVTRTDEQWLAYLIKCHDKDLPELKRLDSFYEGKQPLSYMAPELQAEMEEQVRQVVINWPRLVVDSLEERLDVEGFRLPNHAQADDELWRIWQANDMDEQSQQGHLDALVMGRAYVVIGSRKDDPTTPLVTLESPLDMYADFDPQTRTVRAAVKRYCETDAEGQEIDYAALYLPDATSWWVKEQGAWKLNPDHEKDEHNLGEVMVEVLVNRPRLKNRKGVSELADVIPLSDAACKQATDMMVTAEYHATPRRVAFGFGEEDFVDASGRKVSAFSRVIGRIWATEKNRKTGQDGDGADVLQFPEASLTNFHESIKLLAQLVASLAGLPPHFLGQATDNPASADGIRSSETRLVKRAERRQRTNGGTWERVNRKIMRLRDGSWNPDARSMETIWRDASTPTIAQSADAAVKKHAAGIVPLRQTREDLRYTQAQIERMEEQDEKDAQDAMRRIMSGDLAALEAGAKPTDPAPEPDDELVAA